ncbi:MAG: hypothetical protein B7X00_01250 [Legionella sp. 21-45-4]|jgi:BMFP domain-containing protein YqiC|nr:MAG: hypothetical protein B7X00_01250 [Legionella sp. 21-45-4]
MFNSNQFDDLAQKLFTILPAGLQSLNQDIRQQFKDILNAAFTQMDLLTREEFDVQIKVLQRTREKVEQLEHDLKRLTEAP